MLDLGSFIYSALKARAHSDSYMVTLQLNKISINQTLILHTFKILRTQNRLIGFKSLKTKLLFF